MKCCIVICIVIVNAILVVQRRIDRISHRRVYIKKVFLQISQDSQENTCARVFSWQIFSCEFSEIWKTTFFTKHLWATAPVFRTMSNMYDRRFLWKYRSSHPEMFFKKVFLEISCNFIKKETLTLAQVFSCEFCEISKNTFS